MASKTVHTKLPWALRWGGHWIGSGVIFNRFAAPHRLGIITFANRHQEAMVATWIRPHGGLEEDVSFAPYGTWPQGHISLKSYVNKGDVNFTYC